MKRRILSIITALALCLSLCPTWAFAVEDEPDTGLCNHHREHIGCGYVAPTEGHDCGHQHTAECYTKGILPDADSGDPYQVGGDTENLLDCQHSHDSACGYVQADPGAPCGYVCRICPIEDLIAALPEQVTEDNADDVRAQLDHILDLYRELDEGEQEEIDLSRIYALQGALEAANDPAPAAADEVKYQVAAWNSTEGKVSYSEAVVTDYTLVVDSATAVTWNAGWYVVNTSVTIDQPITVTGAVNLILADGCTLNAEKGIVVTTDNSLTIYAQTGGTGTLTATGTVDSDKNASAGIGGSAASVDSGTITIHGGEIKATGGSTGSNGYGGAGIGGGTPNSGNGGSSGAITIYGGTVTANSGEGGLTGAGIGGGGGKEGGTSSNITIYGGSVTAASIDTSTGGAGIGGGSGFTRGGGDSNIQIHGGTVNATGGRMGAGIGGGADSAGTSGNGTVTISGGSVTAVGGQYAAGIGGGGGYYYSSQYGSGGCTGGTGSVTISGGIVDASSPTEVAWEGYEGAPIGNGGNTTATATVNKTTGIVFENGAGTVYGDVTLDGSYTVPAAYTLNIPAGASLSGSGTFSGGSVFTTENLTADMISVPTNLYYDGKDRTEYLTTELSGGLDKGITICGQTFTVSGWTLAVAKTDDLHYTATYTNNNDNTNTFTKTITLQKSGTDLTEGKVQTYKGDTLTKDFTAGDTITVKATPTPTGDAPQKAAARLRADPTEGQMVVYVGTTQVSVPADKGEDGTYTMTVSAADVLLAAGGPGTEITLTAKFVGNDNMADGAGTVDVNISAAARVEKDGTTSYVDKNGLNTVFASNSGYEDATVTLLDDVTNTDYENLPKIDIRCTLNLNGHTIRSDLSSVPTLGVIANGNVTITGSGEIVSNSDAALYVVGTAVLEGGIFRSGGTYHGAVEVLRGNLSITGENVVMENTGSGNGLLIYDLEAVRLSAGKYSGAAGAISVSANGFTLSSLLNQEGASRVAYYKDNATLVTEGLDGQTLPSGSYTVKACAHAYQYTHTTGATTHSQTCPACGDAKAAETCSYDAATGRCACGSTLAVTLPADLALTYDGTAKTPAVTVTVDGTTTLTKDTDYSVAYENNVEAGEDTAKVTVTGKTFTGTATLNFSIGKATLTVKADDQTITYGGNIATGTNQVTSTGLASGDTLESVTLEASSDQVAVAGKTITPSGAVIKRSGEDVTANYNITYQPGALTINKAQAAVTGNPTANTLTYTGAAQTLVTAGTASVGEVVYSLTETGTYSTTIPTGTNADSYTVWYKVEGTTNYEGTDLASVDVTIAQATAPAPQTGTLNVQNGHAREYTYDLSRLLPVLASGQSFGGEVTYTLKTVNITVAGYYDSDTAAISGTTLTLPVKAVTSSDEGQIGTITVTISSKNFADVDATINVKRVNKQPVSIEGVTAQNGTYNGESHDGYTGTPTASPYSGGFTVTYAKADGTALSGPPTNAGDYTVTISLNPNDTYTGSRTLSFTIAKASITITADDKRADAGAAKPALTYTVTGLASGDTLTTEPTLTCDADMNTIGQYPITASGAAVPSGGNYNTAITYVPGTLSVTDPTISVTGVTLNKTSTTLTVGGSERLTATITPSDATDKSVTWASSNTAVATVDANGTVTAVSAGTATITVTTADGAKTATCTVTVRTNSSGGGGGGGGGGTTTSPTVTVPVSGDKSTVHVSASVSGTTATVSKIDTSQIENVIGDNGQASMVEIDFTGLGKIIDTVKLPAAAIKDIAAKAQNEEVRGLTVKLPEAEISFDAKALSAIQAQAGSQITLTVTPAKPADLNSRQKEAVGSAPVFDLTLRSSSGAITDFRGGYATVSLPYTLAAGQNPSGVVVYYLDSTGNITPCTTMYDVGRKSAIFTTGHLSLYFVGYDPTAVWVNPFSDVAEGAWYYDAVRYASENGLMGGYGNGKFGPNDTLTRAQFAQILFNKEGRPVVNYLLQYGDVATSAWYTEAVRWATSQGVVSGYGNGMFGPNDNITREQLAVMLWRYAGSPAATEKELHFTDADKASGYALEALRWAVENGVMGGYGNGQLAPQGLATRAQVAQMLKNFIEFQQEVSS